MFTRLSMPATLSLKRPTAPLATAKSSGSNLPTNTAEEVSRLASMEPSKLLSAALIPVIRAMEAGRICWLTEATTGCDAST
jgi:hypothetical protein